MNPYTGHLKVFPEELRDSAKDLCFEPIPKELEGAAKKKLAGGTESLVSLTSGGKLSKWAAKKRKERRKMAKESMRRNRR